MDAVRSRSARGGGTPRLGSHGGGGPDATAKSAPPGDPAVPRERAALLAWLAASTRLLLDALREAGPDRGCWTWWGTSQSPRTCGAVARHQLHEIAVHTYDAQLTVGAARPLPDEVALDGVEEFLFTLCTTTVAWPHEPAAVDYHATEGRSWRNWLSAEGARAARLAAPGEALGAAGPSGGAEVPGADEVAGADEALGAAVPGTGTGGGLGAADHGLGAADATARGAANDLVLAFYGRIPLDSLTLTGNRRVFDRLVAWDPGA